MLLINCIKTIIVLSVIDSVMSHILYQLAANMTCGLADSEVKTVRMPQVSMCRLA